MRNCLFATMEYVPMFWNNLAENAGRTQAIDRVLQINPSEFFVMGGGGNHTPFLLTELWLRNKYWQHLFSIPNTMNNFFFSINAIINLLCQERTEMNEAWRSLVYTQRIAIHCVLFLCYKVKYASLFFKITQGKK